MALFVQRIRPSVYGARIVTFGASLVATVLILRGPLMLWMHGLKQPLTVIEALLSSLLGIYLKYVLPVRRPSEGFFPPRLSVVEVSWAPGLLLARELRVRKRPCA